MTKFISDQGILTTAYRTEYIHLDISSPAQWHFPYLIRLY